MGVATFTDMKAKGGVSSDKAAIAYVSCIADAITRELKGGQSSDWEVVVFEGDSVNAFALPGRKIGVYTGMLTVAQNQDQLAAVIGHEVGHVLACHGNERMSIELASQTGQQLAGAAIGSDPETVAVVQQALGMGAQLGISLPHSRAHESEADIIGLQLMANAGFDPAASVQLWHNMSADSQQRGGQAPSEFMSTHPAHQARIEALKEHMPTVQPYYRYSREHGRRPQCRP